jgi:hypothetical protein
MEQSQWYIGTPNGVVMCVDSRQEHQFQGRLYHAYSREGKRFGTMEQLLTLLEQFYNWMNFPYPGTDDRSFMETGKERIRSNHAAERTKIMKDEELLSRHGELGTFVIRVQHRQNSSWQGRITWMDKNKTVCFRSVWELIKLVDGALDTVCSEEDSQDEVSWTEG